VCFASLVFDLDALTLAHESGEAIRLTRGELAILHVFVTRPGRVISRNTLLDALSSRRFEAFDRSVDVLVGRLRRKIEPNPRRPTIIVTVPGSGYKFVAEVRRKTATTTPKSEETADRSGLRPERRHMTVLCAELLPAEGRTLPADPEDLHAAIDAFRRCIAEALALYAGVIGESRDREVVAYFGYPLARENDAERAVRAALAIQRALLELNARSGINGLSQFSARIGLESVPVMVDATGEAFGNVSTIASQVRAAAMPHSVLVTRNVQRQIAGLFVAEEQGAHHVKDASEALSLYRIVRASGGRRFGARTLTPLVGREEELELLARRWERARTGEGQLVLVVGKPGIGKSRLIEEFRIRLGETPHTFVEWTSLQLLQNSPLHPIAEWGRLRFGGADVPAEQRFAELESTLAQMKLDPAENAPLLAPLFDIPLPEERAPTLAPDELRRRQLAALTAAVMATARVQPVVLAIEDLHWADPTTIDVAKGIAERGALAPLFVLATTRPEFNPPWGMRSHHATITLAPLDREQVHDMIAELSARHALPREVMDDVVERTGGVPLFVEEVTRFLLERGEHAGVQAIPPTLQQSLMARLDRLGPAREVAQIGAVIGRGFSYALLRWIAGIEDASLQAALDRLADADILLVQGVPPDSDYRFKHALIQDAAYENLLKSRRQGLHRQVAEVLRDKSPRSLQRSRKCWHTTSPRRGSMMPPSNGGRRPARRRCAIQPFRRRSRISAKRSRWPTKPARLGQPPRPHPLRPANASKCRPALARRLCYRAGSSQRRLGGLHPRPGTSRGDR
jgi:class 3 adenylate cyclase